MTHSEYRQEIEKRFSEYADQTIVQNIIEGQMIPENMSFSRFYHQYQAQHLEKYGEYLQIPIGN